MNTPMTMNSQKWPFVRELAGQRLEIGELDGVAVISANDHANGKIPVVIPLADFIRYAKESGGGRNGQAVLRDHLMVCEGIYSKVKPEEKPSETGRLDLVFDEQTYPAIGGQMVTGQVLTVIVYTH